MTTALIRSVEL